MELHINEIETASTLEKFLTEKLERSGMSGYIIGLSGGIDSSLSAAVAVRAVGSEKVLGLILPYSRSHHESEKDAILFAAKFQINTEKIDITPMIEAYFGNIDNVEPVRAGNKMARERMSILFDRASQYRYLVLGTSNRTEICLGYGTWYGDVACSVNPLGMLYKSQVRQLASYYQIPESIISKPPTADLWPGQTDEGELGLEYEKVDRLLFLLIEKQIRDRKALNEVGFNDRFIDRTLLLLNRSYFKRHLPEIADIGYPPIPDHIIID